MPAARAAIGASGSAGAFQNTMAAPIAVGGHDHRRERQHRADRLAGQQRSTADAHRQQGPQRALIALAGEARKRQRHDQQRQQHQRGGCGRELAEPARRRRILDRPVARELLLVRFKEDEHADEGIEPGIDRRQRLHRLEHERAVVRGRVRIHVALVEPHVPLRLLRIGVLPRDL